jgi:hypothetical protein
MYIYMYINICMHACIYVYVLHTYTILIAVSSDSARSTICSGRTVGELLLKALPPLTHTSKPPSP